jgi:rhodanese-related sulfurtransferase
MTTEISPEDLRKRLDAGEQFPFFDVREAWEYEEVNIGATNFPLAEIPFRLDELQHLRHSEIIIHCKSGARGRQARKFLMSKGFTNVRNLAGGIEAYLVVCRRG